MARELDGSRTCSTRAPLLGTFAACFPNPGTTVLSARATEANSLMRSGDQPSGVDDSGGKLQVNATLAPDL